MPSYPDLSKPLTNKNEYPDFSIPEEKENLDVALSNAPLRIAEDITSAALSGIKAIPSYYQKAKIEIPGMFNVFREHPYHGLGQGIAGVAQSGKNIFNTPHDIINYLSERLHLVPEDVNKIVQMGRMPEEETEKAITQTFGEPKYPGENLIKGVGRHIQGITAAGNILKVPFTATKKVIPREFAKKYQVSHDALLNSAEQKFNIIGNEVSKRNISPFKLRPKLIDEIIDQNVMPDTVEGRKIIEGARNGDYQSLRDLQSQMFHKGTKALGNDLPEVSNRGAKILELRKEVNNSLENHLRNEGHNDLAQLLKNGRNQYRTLKDLYYNKEVPLPLRKLIDKESRKIPKNAVNTLSEESEPISKLKEYNPFIEQELKKHQKQQNALRTLKVISNVLGKTFRYGIPIGTAYLGYEYGRSRNK